MNSTLRSASISALTPEPSSFCAPPAKEVIGRRRARESFASPDRDLARLGVLGLWQGQGQHAVFEIGADLLLVDCAPEGEGARVMADVVFGVDGLHVLVLRKIDAAVDAEHVLLDVDVEVLLLDARHLEHDGERLLGLADVGVGNEVTARDRLLLLGDQLLLFADRHFLELARRQALSVWFLAHVALTRSLWTWPWRSRPAAG